MIDLERAVATVDRGVRAVKVSTSFGTYLIEEPTIEVDGALGTLVEGWLTNLDALTDPRRARPRDFGPVRLELAESFEVVS